MCGIAGAIGAINQGTVDLVGGMNGRIAHRGPDGERVWVSPGMPGPGVVLAHRRLAIIDLSDAGLQPMLDPGNGNMIAFNGEIYNYLELREELRGLGHEFRT